MFHNYQDLLNKSIIIDIDLYEYDLEVAISIYLIREVWSTLLGDSYIRTLHETFGVEKWILLELCRYRRLIDLVFRSLGAIVEFEGYIPKKGFCDIYITESKDANNKPTNQTTPNSTGSRDGENPSSNNSSNSAPPQWTIQWAKGLIIRIS